MKDVGVILALLELGLQGSLRADFSMTAFGDPLPDAAKACAFSNQA
jgi:hypothetical protein